MFKQFTLFFAVVALLGSVSGAPAATPKKKLVTKWQLTTHVVNAAAGRATITVKLLVGGKSQAVHVASAGFMPLDSQGNTCGLRLAAQLSGKTATFQAPHPGANALSATLIAKSAKKVSGKYLSKSFASRIHLGGEGYQCAHVASPPPQDAVCRYDTASNPAPNGYAGCGIPSGEMPVWIDKPTLAGGVLKVPPIASPSGYCWVVSDQVASQTWLGATVVHQYYQCSTGTELAVSFYLYLGKPGNTNAYDPASYDCRSDANGSATDHVLQLLIPEDWSNGWFAVETKLVATSFDTSGKAMGDTYEYADEVFYNIGNTVDTVDGCAQLTARATTP